MFKPEPTIALALCIFASGCTAAHHRKSADKEAAKVIAAATPSVPNMDTNFTIEAQAKIALETLPAY